MGSGVMDNGMTEKSKKIRWKTDEYMKTVEKNGVTYLKYRSFEPFEKTIIHGFSTRLGGVSKGIYESMNLSFTRGDEEEAVFENYRRISEAIGFLPEDIVCSDQTHTTNVRRVGRADRGKGIVKARDYTDVDCLITNAPGIVLATFYADCVPLFFVDPKNRAIGLSHSGWRGTVGKIGKVTVEKMEEEFGCDPADILGAVGPSICQDCYEVSEDVIKKFRENYDENLWPEIFYQKENGKYQLDLWKANEIVLLDAGVLPEHIEITDICTCCNPDLLFSHRASHGKRGNLGAFLCLK